MAREKKVSQTAATAKEELFNKLGIRQNIDITKLEYNEGQIEGLSKNPRWLHDDEGKKLKKSLIDSPEFLEYKPLMVYAMDNGNYVTICGNMRLRIANELRLDGHSEFDTIPCVVLIKQIHLLRKSRSTLLRIMCKLVIGIGMSLPMVNGKPMLCRIGALIVRSYNTMMLKI